MQITQYLHVALLVSDLSDSEYFYGTILGLSKVDRVLKFPGAWYQIGAVQIHLILAERVSIDWVDERWGRNRHIALAVTSLEEAKERLVAYSCPVQMSASGRAALFTHDPDLNIIELSEVVT